MALLSGSWACSADFSADLEAAVRPTDHAAPAAAQSRPTPPLPPPPPAPQTTPSEVPPAAALPAPEPPVATAIDDSGVTALASDDDSAPSLESPPLPTPDTIPVLLAIAREVFVYERPSFEAKKLGYLRAGARVTRSPAPAATPESCKAGFYRVAPAGYVCVANGVRLGSGDLVEKLVSLGPDRSTPLPYTYARSRLPAPPLYVKLPSAAEERSSEPELAVRARGSRSALDALPLAALPEGFARGELLPTPFGYKYPRETVTAGRALNDSAFAILSVFQHRERRYALTADLLLVPLDRLTGVTPSSFHGITLTERAPVVFVLRRGAFLYSGSGAERRIARALDYREGLTLSGRSEMLGGVRWLETSALDWLRDEGLVHVDPPQVLPAGAKAGRSWISVSISKQTLVAFEGERPVYATLVSTGVDGSGDPESTRSTVRGQFLIHTKHVSVTMNSDEVGDEYDLRDVPYVQYFHESYALHAAYWHDGFGSPRSHGCINLAPLDARWLFRWTYPPVPPTWHGAYSLRDGTLIDIEP
jgi:hypothetical protein